MTRKIAFFYNPYSQEALSVAQNAEKTVQKLGAQVVWVQNQKVKQVPVGVSSIELCDGACDINPIQNCHAVVIFGGDGSILQVAHLLRTSGLPIFAINLGKIGFISQAELKDADAALADIIDGKFDVQKKLTIEFAAKLDGKTYDSGWALNEISIEKLQNKPIRVSVVINEEQPLPLTLDSLVCSTPTGSTAHAFSAGGPVVWPDVECISLVPSGAHAMFNKFIRPMVLSQNATIKINIETYFDNPVRLSCDGARIYTIKSGTSITIRRSEQSANFVKLHSASSAFALLEKFNVAK